MNQNFCLPNLSIVNQISCNHKFFVALITSQKDAHLVTAVFSHSGKTRVTLCFSSILRREPKCFSQCQELRVSLCISRSRVIRGTLSTALMCLAGNHEQVEHRKHTSLQQDKSSTLIHRHAQQPPRALPWYSAPTPDGEKCRQAQQEKVEGQRRWKETTDADAEENITSQNIVKHRQKSKQ